MAKNVYKQAEITVQNRKLFIDAPALEGAEAAQEEELAPEEYSGPTADELRTAAEAFKVEWEKEKRALAAKAEQEAGEIIKNAEAAAFEEVQRKSNQAQKTVQEARDQAETIVAEARAQADRLDGEIQQKVEQTSREAYAKGFEEGRESGHQDGSAEVKRLVDRLHAIISRAIEKRNEILIESETQIIDLVLLISRKVIKVISENQKNVVINNVLQALQKLKSRGEVTIRVNLADLELSTEHVADFTGMVEGTKSITVLEDASVGRGGCIIETDFGQIDARISSQLREIEERILAMAPIRSDGDV